MIQIYGIKNVPEKIMLRARADVEAVKETVAEIIKNVRERGDEALLEYTEKFDGVKLTPKQLRVSEQEIKEAYENTPKETIDEIKKQIALARKFAKADFASIKTQWQTPLVANSYGGLKTIPIGEVGLYVPGGKNPFPTVMQILAVPAKIAGCKRIVAVVNPCGKQYETLIAADLCGVDEIYKAGGAQAIAALAYGTETIRRVYKITGPGNPYVTAAKLLCFGQVDIDMPAGPSEALIIADEGAKPSWLAADILARAEHGPDSAAICVVPTQAMALQVQEEVETQKSERTRGSYIDTALDNYSAIVVSSDIEETISFANEYAPEHMEVQTRNAEELLPKIVNAGSVFLGYYNPVAVGDYASGVNHILPTGQWAKIFSPVNVSTYMKKVQFSKVGKEGLVELQSIVDTIATVEGLDAHRESVDIRLRWK